MRCVILAYVQSFSDMKMHQTHAQINTEPFFMSWKPSPLRLSKNSLCCFCAIRTQRQNPTFFGSKICLPMFDISLLPIFLGMYFYRHPKLQFQERGKSVASRACWKFQDQVKSLAPRSCWNFQEQRQSVAWRVCWRFQKQVQSLALSTKNVLEDACRLLRANEH